MILLLNSEMQYLLCIRKGWASLIADDSIKCIRDLVALKRHFINYGIKT